MEVIAENIRKFEKNSLRGFFDLVLDGLLRVNGCTVFCKGGAWWFSLPSKPYQDKDGNTKYQPIVEFDQARREGLSNLVLPQIRAVLEEGPLTTAKMPSGDYPKSEKQPNARQQKLDEARDWNVPDDSLDDCPF